MTEENELDLLITKLESVSKKKQRELLYFMFIAFSGSKDEIINFLNYKKLKLESKNIEEGDMILVPITLSMYPSISKEYYESKGLIDDSGNVRVKVTKISPVESYIWLEVYTSLNIVSEVKVYDGHIPKQEDLFDL